MTELLTANIGNYPRIGEDKDQQRHRRALAHFQNKEISAHAFKDVEQSIIQEIIREQIGLGLDEITDGLVHWQDPISHFCSHIQGITIKGLQRYFDTNFYFRSPVITAKPKIKAPFLYNEFLYAKEVSNKPIRSVLTGPFTLAKHTKSELKSFSNFQSRLSLFTELLEEEIKLLVKNGAIHIQVDEPALGKFPHEFPLFKKSIQILAHRLGQAKMTVSFQFNSVASIYEQLSSLPVHFLHLDLTNDTKRIQEKIFSRPLVIPLNLGILNARSIRLEAIDPLLNFVRNFIEKKNPEICVLSPSAGLEFLPRDIAMSKLKILTKLKTELTFAKPTEPLNA